MTQSAQSLPSKYMWLLIGWIRVSSKCWCGQFVCLRRESGSLDNKGSQPNRRGLWFSPHHSLRRLACHFPLLCIQSKREKCWLSSQSKKEKCWSSLLSSSLLVTREEAATAEHCAGWKHSIPVSAPRYLFDIWGAQHWNQSVAPRWESFHITVRSRKQEVTGWGRVFSSLLLCLASVKHKRTYTHSPKPAAELQHAEGHACSPDWHLRLDWVKFQAHWFPNCLLNLLDAQIVLPRRLCLPWQYIRSRKHLIQNSGSHSRGLHVSYHLLHLIVHGLIWWFITAYCINLCFLKALRWNAIAQQKYSGLPCGQCVIIVGCASQMHELLFFIKTTWHSGCNENELKIERYQY